MANRHKDPDNKLQKFAQTFTRILGLISPGGLSNESLRSSYRIFGLSESGFSIPHANATAFEIAIAELMAFDPSIRDTYTRRHFENKVAEILHQHRVDGHSVDCPAVERFFQSLVAVPVSEYTVFRPLYGTSLNAEYGLKVIGPFTIYNFDIQKKNLDARLTIPSESFWRDAKPSYLIATTINARESNRAVQLADDLFEKFDLCVRYMVGSSRNYEISVLSYRGWSTLHSFVFSKDQGFSSDHSNDGPMGLMPLDDEFFVETQAGFDRVWTLLKKPQLSDLERRLMLAIEWLAQSYNERSLSSAFIKAAIASEVLLVAKQDGPLSTSIVSQISESMGLLLGGDVEERKRIVKEMKDLYGIRSAIAHGGKNDIEMKDARLIQFYVRQIIMKLMTSPELRDKATIQEVHEFLLDKKYGFAPI